MSWKVYVCFVCVVCDGMEGERDRDEDGSETRVKGERERVNQWGMGRSVNQSMQCDKNEVREARERKKKGMEKGGNNKRIKSTWLFASGLICFFCALFPFRFLYLSTSARSTEGLEGRLINSPLLLLLVSVNVRMR